MYAVIMAGGKGTRLRSVAADIPKPMVSVLDKPIVEYQINSLKKSGVHNIIIIVGYLGDHIKDYFGTGEKLGVNIEYITEDKPLGTAGALYYLKDKIKNDFLLIFGDLILDVDWNRFMDFHKVKKGLITLYGHPNSHPYDSDLIVTNSENRVTKIMPKNEDRNFNYHNFVNSGIYCVSPKVLECINNAVKTDLEKNVINKQIDYGTVFAYKATEYVKDAGTPERLQAVSNDVGNNTVENKCLRNKQKCVFLDRDGTVNKLKGFLCSEDEFELLPKVAEAIKRLNSSEYITIIATNQPVIARGECTFDELEQIHMKLETELGKAGAYVDDIFYCPHHPHRGYDGEVKELKFDCECRKPKIGMLKKASEKYNIDLSKSWYIGDTTMDIQTGINAGTRTILLGTGEGGKDGKYDNEPEFRADNLLEAVNIILNSN